MFNLGISLDLGQGVAAPDYPVGRCGLTNGHIKSMLKAPGIKLSKLKYDRPLSNFAFKFNLRRYNPAAAGWFRRAADAVGRTRLTL
jgi:hypothetical protein